MATPETESTIGDEEDDKWFEERTKQYLFDSLLDTIEVHVGGKFVDECLRGAEKVMKDMQWGE